MNTAEIIEILQEHKNHLIELKKYDIPLKCKDMYFLGAIDCIDNLAIELGVELE